MLASAEQSPKGKTIEVWSRRDWPGVTDPTTVWKVNVTGLYSMNLKTNQWVFAGFWDLFRSVSCSKYLVCRPREITKFTDSHQQRSNLLRDTWCLCHFGEMSHVDASLVEHNRDESFLQCNMLSSGTELWINILFMVPSNWIWTRGLVNHRSESCGCIC